MDNLIDMDLYKIIGVEPTATEKEIQKAFRKKSLICHPDKNPNNPNAAALFIELKAALLFLTDTASRARYDKIVNAKLQAKLRAKQGDAKRQKLINDLEYREAAARRGSPVNEEQRFKATVERVEQENLEQMQEELKKMRQQVIDELSKSAKYNENNCRIKIRWKEGNYDYSSLYEILSKYGEISALVLSGKKGRAMVQFLDSESAKLATEAETGLAGSPLILKGLWDSSDSTQSSSGCQETNKINPKSSPPSSFTNGEEKTGKIDFEEMVLANLRKAEERKRQTNLSPQNEFETKQETKID